MSERMPFHKGKGQVKTGQPEAGRKERGGKPK
jgi:hypothetical protein